MTFFIYYSYKYQLINQVANKYVDFLHAIAGEIKHTSKDREINKRKYLSVKTEFKTFFDKHQKYFVLLRDSVYSDDGAVEYVIDLSEGEFYELDDLTERIRMNEDYYCQVTNNFFF